MNAIYDLIDQYINYLIVEKGLADATIESYSGDLKKFADCLKSEKVGKIDAIDTAVILKYLIRLRKEGLTARSPGRGIW